MSKKNRNPRAVNYIWVLAGGYLIYLALKTLYVIYEGDASHPQFSGPGAVLFLLLGGWLIYREWKTYNTQPYEPEESDEAALPEEAGSGEAGMEDAAEEESDNGDD